MDPEANYSDCVNRLLNLIHDNASKENGVASSFMTEQGLVLWEMRKTAITKGLAFIYKVSKNTEVFNTFGNDIIQCFYDISKVGHR